MKKVAILQSNYIPWKGYFDIIRKVDLFIFYDDVQYTKFDWRNRNKIKTSEGLKWLTIPCGNDTSRLICEVKVDEKTWQEEHWRLLKQAYEKTPYFKEYSAIFEEIYLSKKWRFLSELNQHMIKVISHEILGLQTVFEDSRIYNSTQKKEQRILDLAEKSGATYYLSGPAAKDYLHEENFKQLGVELAYIDYSGYAEYPQKYPPFEHGVSILDLIFNTGPDALKYMLPE